MCIVGRTTLTNKPEIEANSYDTLTVEVLNSTVK